MIRVPFRFGTTEDSVVFSPTSTKAQKRSTLKAQLVPEPQRSWKANMPSAVSLNSKFVDLESTMKCWKSTQRPKLWFWNCFGMSLIFQYIQRSPQRLSPPRLLHPFSIVPNQTCTSTLPAKKKEHIRKPKQKLDQVDQDAKTAPGHFPHSGP